MIQDIYFITGNEGKAREYKAILGDRVKRENIDLIEIQDLDSSKIIEHKLVEAYKQLHKPLIVEDVSLVFTAIAPLPGPFIKWFLQSLEPEGIIKLVSGYTDRSAVNTTTIGMYDGKEIHMFTGVIKGSIATTRSGDNGFGWDSTFIPDGQKKTLAEMTADEKNTISSRRLAIEQLLAYLNLHQS